MAMRVKHQRIVFVSIDAEELEEAAESSKCSVAQFIGSAVANAIYEANGSDNECSVKLMVDGQGMVISFTPGGLGTG